MSAYILEVNNFYLISPIIYYQPLPFGRQVAKTIRRLTFAEGFNSIKLEVDILCRLASLSLQKGRKLQIFECIFSQYNK